MQVNFGVECHYFNDNKTKYFLIELFCFDKKKMETGKNY